MDKQEQINKEYERLLKLFEGADEARMQLLEGQLWEHARMRVQLDELNGIVLQEGLVKVHPVHTSLQKETVAARTLVRLRANYINSAKLLVRELNGEGEEEEELGDFL